MTWSSWICKVFCACDILCRHSPFSDIAWWSTEMVGLTHQGNLRLRAPVPHWQFFQSCQAPQNDAFFDCKVVASGTWPGLASRTRIFRIELLHLEVVAHHLNLELCTWVETKKTTRHIKTYQGMPIFIVERGPCEQARETKLSPKRFGLKHHFLHWVILNLAFMCNLAFEQTWSQSICGQPVLVCSLAQRFFNKVTKSAGSTCRWIPTSPWHKGAAQGIEIKGAPFTGLWQRSVLLSLLESSWAPSMLQLCAVGPAMGINLRLSCANSACSLVNFNDFIRKQRFVIRSCLFLHVLLLWCSNVF